MLMTILDPIEIYDRGLGNLASLQGAERFIFMLLDFDNLMEMEGWDHFYLYDHHFAWYGEMKEWLLRIGDDESLAVLYDYESYLNAHGIKVSPSAINEFDYDSEAYSLACNQWRDRYCELRELRWSKTIAYLELQGIQVRD